MSAIGKPNFRSYGFINADLPTAVILSELLTPLENADTEAKICCVSRKVFFNIVAAASMSVAALTGEL